MSYIAFYSQYCVCIFTFKELGVPTFALTIKEIESQFSPKDNGSKHFFCQREMGFLSIVCASVL